MCRYAVLEWLSGGHQGLCSFVTSVFFLGINMSRCRIGISICRHQGILEPFSFDK